MEGLEAVEIGVRIELVGNVEGDSDFDALLREVVGVNEDFADLVGTFGILAVVEVVQGVGAWFAGIHRLRIIENNSLMSGD